MWRRTRAPLFAFIVIAFTLFISVAAFPAFIELVCVRGLPLTRECEVVSHTRSVQLERATVGLLRRRRPGVWRHFSGQLRVPQEIGLAGYSLLAVPMATFALGTWQVHRRQWKLQLIEDLARKTRQPATSLPEDLSELAAMEYRRVKLVGTFHHEREMYVGPRSPIEPADTARRGLIGAPSQTGNLVITPFRLRDRDLTVLVNRGWVPKSKTHAHKRPEGQVPGVVELVGVVRNTETRPPLGPKHASSGRFWHYKDVAQMADASGAAPILVDAVAESTVEGGPIGGQTNVSVRNEHFSYIITWYSLSAATAFLWYHKYIRRRPLM